MPFKTFQDLKVLVNGMTQAFQTLLGENFLKTGDKAVFKKKKKTIARVIYQILFMNL